MEIAINSEKALTDLIVDGVEFRATRQVIVAWAERHGYFVGSPSDNAHRIAGVDGLSVEGKSEWLTFHEMLEALLGLVDSDGQTRNITTTVTLSRALTKSDVIQVIRECFSADDSLNPA